VTVAPGPDGGEALYIADTHYHRVMIYDAALAPGGTPRLIGSFGEFGDGPGQFVYPTDVCVLAGSDELPERIYVSEYGGNDRISVFDAGYEFLFAFGTQGSAEGVEFDRPQSIEIEPALGELIVVDACNHRVGRFTLEGELVRWIGSPDLAGDAPGSFAYPYGLDLPGNGTALVSEFGNGRVQHIDLRTGSSLGVYGVPGRSEGELMSPWGVVVVGDTVYVLDSGSDRVVSFEAPRRARKVTGS
jgi:DNA-binding beta-propeller fold protein YncE